MKKTLFVLMVGILMSFCSKHPKHTENGKHETISEKGSDINTIASDIYGQIFKDQVSNSFYVADKGQTSFAFFVNKDHSGMQSLMRYLGGSDSDMNKGSDELKMSLGFDLNLIKAKKSSPLSVALTSSTDQETFLILESGYTFNSFAKDKSFFINKLYKLYESTHNTNYVLFIMYKAIDSQYYYIKIPIMLIIKNTN